ncbi:hypothetical protein [Streptomyces sp. AC627_RSS907]|uniref:hypothetical protein n=1 Tax=Streptomyces sp. AC627_RSS907 TaxID=2823684 RepID=UPI001C23A207|nr:hypothetical protein [Streptomyces sp. AC627_RSS907]
MFRGTTARIVVLFLAAALIALPLFAPPAPFASAHAGRAIVAGAQSGTTLSGPVPHDETVTCHTAGRTGIPHGPARVRDRQRTATAPQPEAPERALPGQRALAVPEPVTSGRATGQRARAARDHSPAALQVFRC